MGILTEGLCVDNLVPFWPNSRRYCDRVTINPLNFFFLSFYVLVIGIQFTMMLKHRLTSFITMLAFTPIHGETGPKVEDDRLNEIQTVVKVELPKITMNSRLTRIPDAGEDEDV